MKIIKLKLIAILIVTFLTITTSAQQKRQTPAKPQPKPAAAARVPAPTFENLVPADSYVIYGEVRGTGELVRSSAVNDLLEPVLKLAGPPKEFKTIVKWLNAHADGVMSSRLLVATWPINKEIPEAIIAIEFASAEEATKFATPLNEFLPTVLPPQAPEPTPKPTAGESSEKPKPPAPPKPNFHLQRMGSLVVITPKPWTMKQLKPAGSKLLSEEANFRTAHNRFSSEPVFVFVDFKAIQREEEERRKHYEEAQKAEAGQVKKEQAAAANEQKEAEPETPETLEAERAILEAEDQVVATGSVELVKEAPTPDPISTAMSAIGMSLFSGEPNPPEAVGFALSFEGESFDLRALLLNAPGEKSDAVPFWPRLIPAAPMAPESPNIFPANTELFVTMSLDLPQIYTEMSRPRPPSEFTTSKGNQVTVTKVEFESPFAAIENRLKINLKDDLLPLLGSEVAFRLPMQSSGMFGLPGLMIGPPPSGEKVTQDGSPVLAIAVKDKERLRALLPKLIDSFGFKGASSFAQTERREDTEIVSFANLFSYAFIGNFIVISDAETTRRVVDSYLKQETLAGDTQFKTYSRWQPRQVHGQVYVSSALMESFKTWSAQPGTRMSDQARAFFERISTMAQPITYSLSNEGLGPLHELHLPKSLVLMAVAGFSGEINPSPAIQNERLAIGLMYSIAHAQEQYKKDKGQGSCGTLEQLMEAELISKEVVERSGYRFEVIASGDKFEATAVPLEYGKNGKTSLYIDQTRILRGADRNGASANSSDPPIQ